MVEQQDCKTVKEQVSSQRMVPKVNGSNKPQCANPIFVCMIKTSTYWSFLLLLFLERTKGDSVACTKSAE